MNYFISKSPAPEPGEGVFSARAHISIFSFFHFFIKPEPAPEPFQALTVDKALQVRLFLTGKGEMTSGNTYYPGK
jgi:hypothetical protein